MSYYQQDTYSSSLGDSQFTLNATHYGYGQCFIGGGKLHSAVFSLKNTGSPTGQAYAKLYLMGTGTFGTDGKPNASALATSDAFDVSTLTTSFQDITFTFSDNERYEMTAGSYYVIVFEYTGGSGVNLVYAECDSSSPTHIGNCAWKDNSSTWSTDSADLCFTVNCVGSTIDTYSISNRASNYDLRNGDVIKAGQSFKGISGKLISARFQLNKAGSPTGNAVCKLYSYSGGSPDSVLATSNNLDVSILNTTTSYMIPFTFDGTYTMSANTTYVIVVEYSGGSVGNTLQVGVDNSSPTHTGQAFYYTSGWVAPANQDLIFDVNSSIITIDSYSETNQSNENEIYNSVGARAGSAQSFNPGDTEYNITSCKFYLKKLGSPTGNLTAKLYAHTGTYGTSSKPTGSALATSSTYTANSLTTSFQLIEFVFTAPYKTTAGTKYCVAIEASGGSASNWAIVGTDSSSPTHSGNNADLISSVWYDDTEDDIFYVYGEEVEPGQDKFFLVF